MASPPVQLNVGGTLYTTSLETLTKYPDSLLAKMCNGSMASELEYFIDRDGLMFRHILNFIRNSKLLLPENFGDEELLLEEAHFFGIARKTWDEFLNGIVVNLFFITAMIQQLEHMIKDRVVLRPLSTTFDVAYIYIRLEHLMISTTKSLLFEIFPEAQQSETARYFRSSHQNHIFEYPLKEECSLNEVQIFTRLFNAGFTIEASTGGGTNGTVYGYYVFVRRSAKW